MTDQTEEVSRELDDILLDDLVSVKEQTSGEEEPNVTPGQMVREEERQDIAEAEISEIGGELGITEDTQQTAVSLFKQYAEQADIQGNAIEVLAAACLYAACKIESVPLSPDDFVDVPQVACTRVVLLRRVKSISSTLGLNPQAFFDPTHYVDHYYEELGLEDEVGERAREILTIADKEGISSGKAPTGLAAAAIYNACLDFNRKITQEEIANVADVSEVTIRNRYSDQREVLSTPSDSTEIVSDTEKKPEPEKKEELKDKKETESSAGSSTEKLPESPDLEVSSFIPHVSKDVAENIVSTLKQVDSTDDDLVRSCIVICKEIDIKRGPNELEVDDASLALAIIHRASRDLGSGRMISYPTLKSTLPEHEKKIYRVVSALDELL